MLVDNKNLFLIFIEEKPVLKITYWHRSNFFSRKHKKLYFQEFKFGLISFQVRIFKLYILAWFPKSQLSYFMQFATVPQKAKHEYTV